ncbi:MAG: tetratricopeptide repeat protein [Desulfovibrionales bacterium]
MSSELDYEINKELGECYLFMGELDRAEDYYQKALGSNGVHPDPFLGLATIAVQRGQLDQAMVLYQKAARIEENDKALAGMGLVHMETGAHQEAFEHLKRSLEKNPENLVALYGLIQVAHTLEKLDEAVTFMNGYLAITPQSEEVRFALAGCLFKLGRSDEARPHLEQILAGNPEHESARELLAQL